VNLKSLGLQQDLARRREYIVTLVDGRPVNPDGDALARAETLHPRPFADGTFDIVLAAGVEQFLKIPIVLRPPQLTPGRRERLDLATFLPALAFLIRAPFDFCRERDGNSGSVLVLAANEDQVADAALRQLTFDARHPYAVGAAIGPHGMQKNAGVADILAAVSALAPLVLDGQVVVLVFLIRRQI